MKLKEVLKGNVPLRVRKTPEYPVFCKWCSQNDLKTVSQANKKLSSEIKLLQKSVDFNKKVSGTNTGHARRAAKKLEFLKLCRDRIMKYL